MVDLLERMPRRRDSGHSSPPSESAGKHRRQGSKPWPAPIRLEGTGADLQHLLDSSQPALAACQAQVALLLDSDAGQELADRLLSWDIHASQLLRMAEGWRSEGFPEPRYAFILLAEILEHARRGLTYLSLEAATHVVLPSE
jgi:hypothetical protein